MSIVRRFIAQISTGKSSRGESSADPAVPCQTLRPSYWIGCGTGNSWSKKAAQVCLIGSCIVRPAHRAENIKAARSIP